MAVATSDASARVGTGDWVIDSSICAPAFAHDALLDARHLLGGQFHPEVAARHHHRVAERDDCGQRLDRGGLLQLGHDASAALHDVAQLVHVIGALHERQRDPVDAQRQPEVEIAPVLLGQRRDRQQHVGHVDALALREGTTGDDARGREVGSAGLHAQANLAVVDQQIGARFQRGEDLRMRQAHAPLVARRGIEVETERGARLQSNRTVGEGADAQFGPLQVEQHAYRPAGGARDPAGG
jgi:hypothetical protein